MSFFPRDVLDEILNLIESVSEGFPSYSLRWYRHSVWSPTYRRAIKEVSKAVNLDWINNQGCSLSQNIYRYGIFPQTELVSMAEILIGP